ncbi:hypothetical protein AVEN_122477-1, partial [Araneus ventricosus]
QLHIKDEFCVMDLNTSLEGSMAVEAAPVLRFPGVLLTAVAATSSHDSTVAFLGTSQGHLKKDRRKEKQSLPQAHAIWHGNVDRIYAMAVLNGLTWDITAFRCSAYTTKHNALRTSLSNWLKASNEPEGRGANSNWHRQLEAPQAGHRQTRVDLLKSHKITTYCTMNTDGN